VREDLVLWRRFAALVEEAVAVARAQGIALPADLAAERLELARQLPGEMRSSMLHDLEAGRRLELDWLTGAVVRLGAEAGVGTPASAELYATLAPFRDGAAATAAG
jgi:2-dehydropantoate 2-reductase